MFQQIVLSLFLGQSDEPDSSVTSVRVWDLGFGCHDFWHPVSTDGGPVGYGVEDYSGQQVDKASTALYCREGNNVNAVPCEARLLRTTFESWPFGGTLLFFPSQGSR